MSGLYLLLLIAAWLVLGWVGYRLWRRWAPEQAEKKRLRAVIGLSLAAAWILVPFWEVTGKQAYYDAQVNRLCKKDGGIKVYETVKLPTERFDNYGNIGVRSKEYAKPTDEYYFEAEDQYLRKGDSILIKATTQVIRRSDGKVLGESTRYGRGGGDLPGPWHPSSFDCPQIKDAEGKLESSIFKKGVEK